MTIALLGIDMQGSFMRDGELEVKDAEAVIEPTVRAARSCAVRIMTRDFHDPEHSSFIAQGGPWPPHGVKGTPGAVLHPAIDAIADLVISKGTDRAKDGYSGFANTCLEAVLDALSINILVLTGLATDYCVLNTALDALDLGKYQVVVLLNAIRAVNLSPGDGDRALAQLQDRGAILTTSDKLPGQLAFLVASPSTSSNQPIKSPRSL